MRKILLVLIVCAAPFLAFSQGNIGVGTAIPDASAKLDIVSTNGGILIPRVVLTGATDAATITSPATGLMVWNTGASWGNAGFYYNTGSPGSPGWVKVLDSSNSLDDADADPNNEIQTISQAGLSVTLSDGGGSISVADNDNDPANEYITGASLSGNNLEITDGGGTSTVNLSGFDDDTDADADPANEIQNLSSTTSGTNRTINISSGTGTTLSIADNDNDSGNEIQTLGIVGSTISLSSGGGSVTVPSGADNLGNHSATTILDMNNFNMIEANNLTFNDPGDQEGIIWNGSAAKIFVSPLNGSNADGYLRLINDGGIVFEPGAEDIEQVTFSTNGNVGIGLTSPAEDLHVFRGDGDVARIYATGSSQGSGMFFAGQSSTYGGGFVYDGDGTPALVGGTDRITFFRRSAGTDYDVMSYPQNANTLRISSLAGSGTRMVTANASGDLGSQAIPVNTDNQNLSNSTSGTNRTINISGGTGTTISVADNDNSSSNEIQSLSISGSTISLTGGGGSVTVPSGADNLGNHTATTTVNANNQNITNVNYLSTRALSSYDKLRVYNSSSYTIGMASAQSFGYLNDWAMTFTFNTDADRGFLWRDVSDAASDGAMSLTTDGRLTVKNLIRSNGAYYSDGNVVIDDGGGWHRSYGQTGWYNQTYGGGWYMTDVTWLRAYNNKGIYTAGITRGDGGVHANDRVRMRYSNVNQYGSILNIGAAGIIVEQGVSESGGWGANGDRAAMWSPGDGTGTGGATSSLLTIYDEDGMDIDFWFRDGGTGYADASWTTFSDERIKENIETIPNALDKVLKMRGVSYDLKEEWVAKGDLEDGKEFDMTPYQNMHGFVAQELKDAVPGVVHYVDDRELYAVNYDGVIPVLVEAIKEQQKIIEELRAKIERSQQK